MKFLGKTIAVALGAMAFATPVWAEDMAAEPIARMNSLTYKIEDAKLRERWEASGQKGKALVQGLKFDSAGTMYVTTARWGGADIPATVSKLVKSGDGYELQAFPSEALNDVANAAGLKAVLVKASYGIDAPKAIQLINNVVAALQVKYLALQVDHVALVEVEVV